MTEPLLPHATFKTRRAGVCLHLSSLPGPNGIGEIGAAARDFIDTLRRMRLDTWQFLPLGPTGFGDSPYQPLSSFAGNEMLLDLTNLAQTGLLRAAEIAPLHALPQTQVDFGRLMPLKSALLRKAARRFAARARRHTNDKYQAFVSRHGREWLDDYALFRVLKDLHDDRPWSEWPEQYRQRDEGALQEIRVEHATELATVKIWQFLFDQQWARLRQYARDAGIRLFGDMPIYVAHDSADAWANRELLQLDDQGRPEFVAGVPPDYFSEDGQLWGNPLYDWPAHAATQFHWWQRRFARALDQADIVRIDHFRGFESFWSVPAGETTARAGTWQPGPGDSLFDALWRSFGSLPIVAEDLGVITDEVQALRNRHGMPGMVVLQFAFSDENFSLADIAKNSICYTGTHDNDTTLGWFQGGPGDLRSADEIRRTRDRVIALTGQNKDCVVYDLIKTAYASPACLAMVPMQDYLVLGSETRLNIPGTSGNNWRWRLNESQISDELCSKIADNVIEFDREPSNAE